MNRDLPFWVAFSRVPAVGRVRYGLLEERFGSLEGAWIASSGELRAAGLDARTVNAIAAVRDRIDPQDEMAGLERAGAQAD